MGSDQDTEKYTDSDNADLENETDGKQRAISTTKLDPDHKEVLNECSFRIFLYCS